MSQEYLGVLGKIVNTIMKSLILLRNFIDSFIEEVIMLWTSNEYIDKYMCKWNETVGYSLEE